MAKDAIKMVGKVVKSFSTREYQVELENKMTRRHNIQENAEEIFMIRPPKYANIRENSRR